MRTRSTLAGAALALLLGACGSGPGYRQPLAVAEPAAEPADDRTVHLELIARMQREGAYYASLAHVDAFRQQHGAPRELRLLEAEGLRGTGQSAEARQLYESLTTGPGAAAAWHGLGLIAAGDGDVPRAEQALAKAAELAPLNTDYLGDLGFQRLRSGQLMAARAPLAKAAELAPDNSRAVANLVLWTLLAGDAQRAEAMMQHAALPEASRQAVRRLAIELRPAMRAQRLPPDAVASSPVPGGNAGIPAPQSMLERFRPASHVSRPQDERSLP